MPLTKEERISITGKMVTIPIENALAESVKAELDINKAKAEVKDGGNKTLSDDKTVFVDGYQVELGKYDGDERTELIEQDFQDSANRVLQNPFFPNDPSTPTPSLASGIWPYFIPYAGNKAIGKAYDEGWAAAITSEQDVISDILTKITAVEVFTDIQRSTGQHCVTTGTCDLPQYTDASSCTGGGGAWTPGPDSIETFSDMQTAATDLKTAIETWETFITTLYSEIVDFDTDTTRAAENTASKDDITSSQSIINIWQALADFDTTHGQTTCAGFNGYDVSLLDPTKFRVAELQPIKDELTARQSFITTRISQLEGNLGTITQDLTSGEIISKSGFYGSRFGFIDLRLNVMTGSLSEVKEYDRGKDAQEQLQDANDSALDTYDDVLKVSLFRAPAAGTNVVHVMDGTEFSIGDTVYIAANNQDEITATVDDKDNNTFYLSSNIPKKYTRDIMARMYKLV